METPMSNPVVSQAILDALNAPPEPRPITPNIRMCLINQQYFSAQPTTTHLSHVLPLSQEPD